MYLDREGYQDPQALPPKYIHAGNQYQEQPHLYVDETGVALIGDRKHLIAVDPDFGVLLGGPVSLSTMPDQISFGAGYYRLNPLVLSTVPSTTLAATSKKTLLTRKFVAVRWCRFCRALLDVGRKCRAVSSVHADIAGPGMWPLKLSSEGCSGLSADYRALRRCHPLPSWRSLLNLEL